MKKRMMAVAAAAVIAASPASAEWVEASSDHFVVLGDMSEAQAKGWAEKLERLDRVLRLATKTAESEGGKLSRVTVYVVPDMASVQKLYGGKGNVGGFYRANAQSNIAITPLSLKNEYVSAQEILFHEYTHHILLSSTSGFYPNWVQEGFAEYFSTAKANADGNLILGAPPEERGFALKSQYQMSAQELFTASETSSNRGDVDHLYARGWLLIHMLMSKKDRAGQLDRYLRLMDSGRSSIDAGREAFGDLGNLDRELNVYIKSSKFQGLEIPASKLSTGPVTVRTLSPCEARIMPIRMVSANGVTEKAAPLVAADAREDSLQCPNDAFVQRTLAETEFDAKANDASFAAADRALAIDPGNVMAMVYKGRVLARRSQWADARKWFAKANHAEPNYALPLVLYYDSFVGANQAPAPAALNGLMRAIMLAPQDPSLRIRVARAFLVQDDVKSARAVLLPVANAPDDTSENPADKVIALIDSGANAKTVLAETDKAKWNEVGKE